MIKLKKGATYKYIGDNLNYVETRDTYIKIKDIQENYNIIYTIIVCGSSFYHIHEESCDYSNIRWLIDDAIEISEEDWNKVYEITKELNKIKRG